MKLMNPVYKLELSHAQDSQLPTGRKLSLCHSVEALTLPRLAILHPTTGMLGVHVMYCTLCLNGQFKIISLIY